MLAIPCNSRPGRDNGPDERPWLVARRERRQAPKRGELVPIPGTNRLGLFVGRRRDGRDVIAERAGIEYARLCVAFDGELDDLDAEQNRARLRRRWAEEKRARRAKQSARDSVESFA